jgi:hypothetical protein
MPDQFSGIRAAVDQMVPYVTEGDVVHEKLDEVRNSLATQLSLNDALGIALLYGELDNETDQIVWRNTLDTYVSWKMVNDDEFWNQLGQTA